MSSSKKRPFSEYTAGDFYLCADCDSVYHGQQELCEHLAKHSNLRRQARKRICLRKKQNKDILDYTKKPQQLIPDNLTNDTSKNGINVSKLSGIEQLTQTKKMSDHYYTYHQLKMAVNTIGDTRRKSSHCIKTSLDIIHDINVLKHKANQLNLQCKNTHLFDRIQSKLLGSNFKQPPMKTHQTIVKTVKKKKKLKPLIAQQNDKQEIDDDDDDNNKQKDDEDGYDIVEEEEEIKFQFDSSDFQRYLDANSEIIGRLQAIRREKSFFGVTQEEIDLSKQFAGNTAAIVQYSSLPQRLLI